MRNLCYPLKVDKHEVGRIDTRNGEVISWAVLRSAEQIFFVGYRFPPTDVHARNELLKAIGENKSLDFLGIILGPNTQDDAVKRLERFLLSVTKGRVRTYPYYCEEFFTLYAVTRDPKQIDRARSHSAAPC